LNHEFAASMKPQRAAASGGEGPQLASRRSASSGSPQAATPNWEYASMPGNPFIFES